MKHWNNSNTVIYRLTGIIIFLLLCISLVFADRIRDREGLINISPSVVGFAPQSINTTSDPVMIYVSNAGDSTLLVTSVIISGVDFGSFILNDDNRYPVILNPGTAMTFRVSFHPTSLHDYSAEILIMDDTSDPGHSVPMSGIGCNPYISCFPFTEDFEDYQFPPTDWLTYNSANQNSGWRHSSMGNPHTGNGYAVAGLLPGNHWLFSPPFIVTPFSNTLRFWLKNSVDTPDSVANAINEFLDVMLTTSSSADTLHLNHTLLHLTNADIPESYMEVITDLSSYSGSIIRIAFLRHSTNGKYVYLDDFSVSPPPAGTINPPTGLTAVIDSSNVHLGWRIPSHQINDHLSGYRIYRNNILIQSIGSALDSVYTDTNLMHGYYIYKVTAIYGITESIFSNEFSVDVTYGVPNLLFHDSFESYTDFTLNFGAWMNLDADQSNTFNFNQVTFPNMTIPKAFMIFNPSSTNPPMTTLATRSGNRMLACFDSADPPNDDWLITPHVHLGMNSSLEFWAKSYTAVYGLERFNVLISTSDTAPASFISITEEDTVSVPAVHWNQYQYDLSAYDDMDVYLAVQCVSDYAEVLLLDDFKVFSAEGYVGNPDLQVEPVQHASLVNYPNPFSSGTTIRFDNPEKAHVQIAIYNIRGQLVRKLLNVVRDKGMSEITWDGRDTQGNHVASGIYFCKMTTGTKTVVRKLLLYR